MLSRCIAGGRKDTNEEMRGWGYCGNRRAGREVHRRSEISTGYSLLTTRYYSFDPPCATYDTTTVMSSSLPPKKA